jgi:hypothetical protein
MWAGFIWLWTGSSGTLLPTSQWTYRFHTSLVMMGCRNRNSFRNLFKIINILPFKSQYILTLLIFVVNNNNNFTINAGNYNILARQRNNLHLPQGKYGSFLKRSLLFGNKNF